MSVATSRHGNVLVATLNRPEKRNALNRPMLEAFVTILRDAEVDPTVTALAIRGEGDHFCAGADIAEYHGTPLEDLRDFTLLARGLCEGLASASVPVVAVVWGMALGGGMELCLASDVVLAHPSASFGLPELRLGLIPGWGGTQRLPQVVGRQVASDLVLTSGRLDAEAAVRHGVASRVLDAERFEEEVAAYFDVLSGQSGPAMAAAKRALRAAGSAEGPDVETAELMGCFAGADGVEGVAAFVERRPPVFREGLA